jgi:hypothetical protein
MKMSVSSTGRPVDRRSFMRSGLLAGDAAAVGAGLLAIHRLIQKGNEEHERYPR